MRFLRILGLLLLLPLVARAQNAPTLEYDSDKVTELLTAGSQVLQGQILKPGIIIRGTVIPTTVLDINGIVGIASTGTFQSGTSLKMTVFGYDLVLVDGPCSIGNTIVNSTTRPGYGHCSVGVTSIQQVGIANQNISTVGLIQAYILIGGSGGGGGGSGTPGGVNGQLQANVANTFGGFTLTGDCSFSIPSITCTKTNGVLFAPSATTDTTNASNISSGTIPASVLPTLSGDVTGSYIGNTVTGLHFGSTGFPLGAAPTLGQCIGNSAGSLVGVLCGGGVSSFSGDGTLLNNSSSTGAVTATLGNAAAHSYFGNNTGALGAPGYHVITAPDLPSTTVNSTTNDTNITGTILNQNLTFAWQGTLAPTRLNANVVQGVTNDTNITGVIATQNLILGWQGTLAAARLNANVVQSCNNDINLTCSISNQALSLGWAGTLSGSRGGWGQTLPNPVRAGDLFYYNGTSWVTVAGNNTGTQFLQETAAGVPSWGSGTNTVAWNGISNPTGTFNPSMGINLTEFDFSSPLNHAFQWYNTTAATSTSSQSGPILDLSCGNEWHAGASTKGCMSMQFNPGSGTDANGIFSFTHFGSATGTYTSNFPGPVQAGTIPGVGGMLSLPEGVAPLNLAFAGQDNCYADSTLHWPKCNFNSAASNSPMALGPASAPTSGDVAAFNGTTGGLLQDGGVIAANLNSNSSNFTTGDVVQATGAHTTGDSGVIAANVTTAASNFTQGHLIQAAGNNKSESDSGIVAANVALAGAGTVSTIPKFTGPVGIQNSDFANNASNVMNNANASTQTSTYAGGQDLNTNVPLGGVVLRGANQTGAGGAGSSGGNVLVTGGSNAATNAASTAGSIEIVAGTSTGAVAPGLQGLLNMGVSYLKGTTVTQWNLECPTTIASTVQDCGATPSNWVGIAESVGTGAVQIFTPPSQTFVNASGSVIIGHTVCAGSVAGQVTDSGGTTTCGNSQGPTVGIVTATAGTWTLSDGTVITATAFLPLIQMNTAVLMSTGSGGGGATLQTNGVNNISQTLQNIQNSAATNGVTITATNPSGGNVQLGISGTLNNSGLTNSNVVVNGTTCTLGSSCAPPGGQVNYPVNYPVRTYPLGLALTTSNTVANTVTATSIIGSTFAGSKTIPAASLLPNGPGIKTLTIYGVGSLGTAATAPTLTVTVLLGGQTLSSISVPVIGSLSSAGWELQYTMTVSGLTTATVGGCVRLTGSSSGGLIGCASNAAVSGLNFVADQTLDVQVTWGTASASNTLTVNALTASSQNAL